MVTSQVPSRFCAAFHRHPITSTAAENISFLDGSLVSPALDKIPKFRIFSTANMRLVGLSVAVLIFQDREIRQGAIQGRVYFLQARNKQTKSGGLNLQNSMVDYFLYPFFVARSAEGTKVS